MKFDEQSFFNTVLGFTPCWGWKHYKEYISQKIINSNTPNKIHLKCDVVDRSVVNGVRQPLIFSVVLDKLAGC